MKNRKKNLKFVLTFNDEPRISNQIPRILDATAFSVDRRIYQIKPKRILIQNNDSHACVERICWM